MSSAFRLDAYICWGTAGSVEDILTRAARLSSAMFGPDHPTSVVLAEERDLYWGGKVVDFSPSAVPLAPLSDALEAAREEARSSGTFTETGVDWLVEDLGHFCHHVTMAARQAL